MLPLLIVIFLFVFYVLSAEPVGGTYIVRPDNNSGVAQLLPYLTLFAHKPYFKNILNENCDRWLSQRLEKGNLTHESISRIKEILNVVVELNGLYEYSYINISQSHRKSRLSV